MKLTCLSEKFKQAITYAERVAARSTTLPILKNILLRVKDNKLFIEATNLEIGLSIVMNAKVEKEGECTVPSKILSNFVSHGIIDGNVSMELTEHGIIFESGTDRTVIKSMDTESFPILPKKNETKNITVNPTLLKKAFEETVFSASVSETRPELTGIFISFDESQMRFAATDSFRLAESIIKFTDRPPDYDYYYHTIKSIIIPKNTIHELLRIMDEAITITVQENQIFFESNGLLLISRLIEGTYPDYEQIMPQNPVTDIKLKKDDFLHAVKTSSIFSNEKTSEIVLEIIDKKGVVSAMSTEYGSHLTELHNASITGIDQKIVFNPRFILDGITQINDEEIIISLTNEQSPILISSTKTAEEFEPSFRYIVMPVRST